MPPLTSQLVYRIGAQVTPRLLCRILPSEDRRAPPRRGPPGPAKVAPAAFFASSNPEPFVSCSFGHGFSGLCTVTHSNGSQIQEGWDVILAIEMDIRGEGLHNNVP